jgi:hypothetical protein
MLKHALLGLAVLVVSSGLAVASDYFTVYQSYDEAKANCDPLDEVMPYYDLHLKRLGYICQQRNSGG